jgi:hypothetical protein
MLALFRLAAEVGTAANWVIVFISAIIAVFVVFIGIAMYAVFRAKDPEQRKVRYKVFRDLLHFCSGRGRR